VASVLVATVVWRTLQTFFQIKNQFLISMSKAYDMPVA
jgi:hypothetical protein